MKIIINFCMVVITLLCGSCLFHTAPTDAEIVGEYTSRLEDESLCTLIIMPDGTFNQTVKYKNGNVVNSNGTWHYLINPNDKLSWFEKTIVFNSLLELLSCDYPLCYKIGKLNPSIEHVFPVFRDLFGNIVIEVDGDRGIVLVKRK